MINFSMRLITEFSGSRRLIRHEVDDRVKADVDRRPSAPATGTAPQRKCQRALPVLSSPIGSPDEGEQPAVFAYRSIVTRSRVRAVS